MVTALALKAIGKLLRCCAIKVMDQGLEGGSSFMEDYTYNFQNGSSTVLGAHMLEICPSIANGKPRCEVHPLSIGGKEDPARLVFDVDSIRHQCIAN